ncbi:MAG TPA: peptidoglycan-binding protein [Leifsonia sp.]|jgi:peptidoglycan hydrolase-like protein with peptidoglycan-binding domain|nr:peptidoglycan-binding protein [Leifsonia sp.]
MEQQTTEQDAPIAQPARRKKRRLIIACVCTLAALVAGSGLTAALAADSVDAKPKNKRIDAATSPVVQGTLQGSSSASGTLAYGGARSIPSGSGGVITSLPAPGDTVPLGEPLFAVDNQPTYLMYGGLPAWRSFQSGMPDGPDVRVLEESLKALGYFDGEPDQAFTWATKAAIIRWQKANGQEQTGSIPFGRIVFDAGAVRIAELPAAVGDPAIPGAPMIKVTDLTKLVNVNLKLSDQQLGVVGGKVTIDLPSGASTTGTIASVGVPTEMDGANGGKEVAIRVVVTLDDPEATGALQQATVTARFPTEKRANVLSVPVGALLALDGNRFGVELVRPDGTTKQVPVKTGLFAAGRVEISGDGIRKGQKVVVPTL